MDRQKKLLIFAAAWVSAGLLTWFLYAKTAAPQQEKQAGVVVATRDMGTGTLLRTSDLKKVNYPEKSIPKGIVSDPKDAVNRVLLVPIANNEPVLASKLSGATTVEGMASTIEPGFRAVSVQITDASGVAGMVQPNAHVDVLFTRPGSMAEAVTTTILENVKVLSTGRQLATGQTVDPRAPRSPVVTLVMSPAEAQKLELAKNQGKISLSLRNPLDTTRTQAAGPITTEVLDPNVLTRAAAAKKARMPVRGPSGPGTAGDGQGWPELRAPAKKEKEPEKPRVVVDVYRGDRHVQELFK
jgi:pilus assembly protein CpaB